MMTQDVESLFNDHQPGRHPAAVPAREQLRWQSAGDAAIFPD
jgi:hypothetical protein